MKTKRSHHRNFCDLFLRFITLQLSQWRQSILTFYYSSTVYILLAKHSLLANATELLSTLQHLTTKLYSLIQRREIRTRLNRAMSNPSAKGEQLKTEISASAMHLATHVHTFMTLITLHNHKTCHLVSVTSASY